jgi:hypothetical protein
MLIAVAGLGISAAQARAVDVELGPAPRVASPAIRVEAITGGYQIALSREAAQQLRDLLVEVGDGSPYARLGKAILRKADKPEWEKTFDLVAFIVRTQAPALRKSIDDKLGPEGVFIKVLGIETDRVPVKSRPIAKAAIEAFMPADVKEKARTVVRVINTTPLYWRVETR